MIDDVTKILPIEIKNIVLTLENRENITEIRLRVGKKLRVYFGKQEKVFNKIVFKQDILSVLSNISLNSIYSVQNDINKGFVTIEGGNRVGIAGEVVIIDGRIKNIKEISSMNIRVAKEFIGIADKIMNQIYDGENIKNTVIVSPPGCGKTTVLRDIIRNLSVDGYNVSVIDERGEIAAMYGGLPSLDIGDRTDVISFVDKAEGMQMAVRSLAPHVVCTDEIGSLEDVEAIKYVCKSGVAFITTLHGKCIEDVMQSALKEIISQGNLDNIIILSGIGNIEKVYTNLNVMEEIKC